MNLILILLCDLKKRRTQDFQISLSFPFFYLFLDYISKFFHKKIICYLNKVTALYKLSVLTTTWSHGGNPPNPYDNLIQIKTVILCLK